MNPVLNRTYVFLIEVLSNCGAKQSFPAVRRRETFFSTPWFSGGEGGDAKILFPIKFDVTLMLEGNIMP